MYFFHNIKNGIKKSVVVLLAAVCMVTLIGCSSGTQPAASETPSASQGVQAAVELTQAPASTAAAAASPSASASESPTVSASESAEASAAESETSEPKSDTGSLDGVVIGLDPGHQAQGNSDPEPVAPGSSETKPKVSSGTAGVASGIDEHVVNLNVGLKLRDMLEEAGATVVMTRTTADVDISNAERAQLFNEENVDLALRLHCNGVDDESVHGAFMIVPESNPYKDDCDRAAELILNSYIEATGLKDKGIMTMSNQTGFNWCERPIVNIEMGHMSNPDEDLLITDKDFQTTMAEGLYQGILAYFEG